MSAISPDYLSHLQAFFAPPAQRGATSAPAAGAEPLLVESRDAGTALAAALRTAQTAEARSRAEVQLLAAAAADLAVAERLAGPSEQVVRGGEDVWALIQTGLTDPDALLRPTLRPARYRGADKDLLAAIYQVLNSIQDATTETISDAITGALTLNMAVLREALKLAGADLRQLLKDLGADAIAALAGEALRKLLALVGEDNLAQIEDIAGQALEKLQEKMAVAAYVGDFLDAEGIYKEGRAMIQAYEGPDRDLARLTPKILALRAVSAGAIS